MDENPRASNSVAGPASFRPPSRAGHQLGQIQPVGGVGQGPALGSAAQGLPADVVEQGTPARGQHCREKPWLILDAHRPRGSRARAQDGSATRNPSGSLSQRGAATAVSCAQARPCGRDVTAHEQTQRA